MVTAALKSRSPAKIARDPLTPSCPAAALLAQAAHANHQMNLLRDKQGRISDPQSATYKKLCVLEEEAWAKTYDVIALTVGGAAFQALAIYRTGTHGTEHQPKGMTEDQEAELIASEARAYRCALSAYRILRRLASDAERIKLDLVFDRIFGDDTLAQVLTDNGLDVMAAF